MGSRSLAHWTKTHDDDGVVESSEEHYKNAVDGWMYL